MAYYTKIKDTKYDESGNQYIIEERYSISGGKHKRAGYILVKKDADGNELSRDSRYQGSRSAYKAVSNLRDEQAGGVGKLFNEA